MNLASSFLSRFPPTANGRAIYVPNPTLPEDLVSLKASGMEIRQFRFLDQRQGGIDWEGLREDLMVSKTYEILGCKLILQYAPVRSAVLLHVSGSAPTGAEFTAPQWRHLTTILLVSLPYNVGGNMLIAAGTSIDTSGRNDISRSCQW